MTIYITDGLLDEPITRFFENKVARFFSWLHPNTITSAGVTVNITTLYVMYNTPDRIYVLLALMGMGFFSDCLDGAVARTTNRVTEFGRLYDAGNDTMLGVGWLVILFRPWTVCYTPAQYMILAVIIATETILTAVWSSSSNNGKPDKLAALKYSENVSRSLSAFDYTSRYMLMGALTAIAGTWIIL